MQRDNPSDLDIVCCSPHEQEQKSLCISTVQKRNGRRSGEVVPWRGSINLQGLWWGFDFDFESSRSKRVGFLLSRVKLTDDPDSQASSGDRFWRSPGHVMQSYIMQSYLQSSSEPFLFFLFSSLALLFLAPTIEEVITKFAQLTPQERAKRKLESLEALKKTFKKLDHDVNIPEFLGSSSQSIEDLTSQSRLLQNQLSDVHKRLSYWTNPDKINSIENLGQLENSLRESLNQIRLHKENLGKQHLMSLECHGQFQNGMHVPFRMGAEQQLPPLLWIPNNDSQHIMLPEDQSLLPPRDAECTASSSFGSYSGYFGAGKNSELSSSGQESGMNGILDDLNGTASLRLQLAGQYPYLPGPYNLNLLNDTKFQPAAEMNVQKGPGDFNVGGSFEAPKPEYDSGPRGWASTPGSCAVTMFDDHLYTQLAMQTAESGANTHRLSYTCRSAGDELLESLVTFVK
ncbi:hypothetical protein DKX38_016050 [Salix brachista]|uniref:MADS-box domain-containing protein n=1 Tax=Salix brachista TaxID=2182728 RepID=A0A5N5L6Z6_9ROSI|nr:hypothetical protein DKX38_016050 [Salix brachista]